MCFEVNKNYPHNLLKPHFDLLAAMCVGVIDGRQKFNKGVKKNPKNSQGTYCFCIRRRVTNLPKH